MSRPARAPRLARWVLTRLLAPTEREFCLGDIEEQFQDLAAVDGAEARRWYRRQLWLAGKHRLRGGRAPRPRGAGFATRIEGALQDVRYATRGLRRSPGFTAVATLTLALGIGSTAMIYAVVDTVLVRGLPFDGADRLVLLRNGYKDGREGSWLVSFPDYEDYRAGIGGLEELAAWQEQQPALSSEDGQAAQRLQAIDATANLLPMLGVEPVLGRGFLPEEDAPFAAQRAALLSHGLWQGRFGGEENVLGRTILLDEVPFQVVGVLPRGFTGVTGGYVLPPVAADIWLSYRSSFSGTATAQGPSSPLDLRGLTNVNLLGKRAPNATLEQVTSEALAVAASLDERFPELRQGMTPQVLAAQVKAVEGVRRPILISFGAVSLLLLIAGTNVASLLVGRASVRGREMALRSALGAGRLRLMRQLVVESLVLASLGAALGALIARLGLAGLVAAQALEIASLDSVAIDGRVLAFLFGVAALAGVVFGAGPALLATRQSPSVALRGGGPTIAADRGFARRALVVAQVALAVILLVGAGLTLRSLERVLRIDPGFETDGILTASVQLPMGFVSPDWPQAVEFFRQFEQRARQLPGVTAVAAAYQLPTDDGWNNAFDFDLASTGGQLLETAGSDTGAGASSGIQDGNPQIYSARFRPVTPGYFELVGIPLVRGRTFTEHDGVDAARVVVVNESFVRRYFQPGANPLGTRLIYGNWWAGGPPEYEIVGVVRDVRFSGRTNEPWPATYFPHAQQPVRVMSLLLHTSGDPFAVVAPLRAELQAIDPTLPLDRVALLSDELAAHESQRLSMVALLVVFAAVALTLAAVGVYGVMAFVVASRTREMGIRVALGAQRGEVRRMVLASGLALAATGMAVGALGAYLLGSLVETLLYEVAPTDPATFAVVAVFLAVVATGATWVPARRATTVDPMVSLRSE